MTTINTKKTAIASVLAAAAIAAPSASAMPIDEHLPSAANVPAGINAGLGPSGGSYGSDAVVAGTAQTPSSTGFDWGDAGVGAAGMLTLICLGAGAVAITKRSQRPDAMAS